MNTLPPVVLVSFKVLLVLKGAAVVPLVIAAAATSEPKTWYNNTSAKFGKAKCRLNRYLIEKLKYQTLRLLEQIQ